VARAAASLGVPMVLSTVSSFAMEEVAKAGGDGPRWFQLYWPRERELAASLLERAARAGFSTLVVTVDTFRLAWRPHDLDNAYLPFLSGLGLANYFSDPFFQGVVGGPVTEANLAQAIGYWTTIFGNPALTWSDLAWARERWRGPIVLKGICHPDDARRAADAGVDGIIVSNHGGRQVDGAVAALDSLPAIVTAVADRLAVLFDSGIRTGGDVIKALALGARAVLVARPYAYALGLAGEQGVRHVLRCLQAELELSLALCGLTHPDQLGPEALTRASNG
jgi:L-lactate dehydrogenase (cytochrome)